MAHELKGKKVAILATTGFEQSELEEPKKALEEAGARAIVVSPTKGQILGWQHTDWGKHVPVDMQLDEADPSEFDALMLPGGVLNPDRLRLVPKAVQFVRAFVTSKKPIAAICHGPWTLIDAGGVRGRRMTSWPSLRVDLENGGANWVDEEVVADQGLVTSRKPDDIPAFNRKMIDEFARGAKERAEAPRAAHPR